MPFVPEEVHGTDKPAARLLDMSDLWRLGAIQLLEAAKEYLQEAIRRIDRAYDIVDFAED